MAGIAGITGGLKTGELIRRRTGHAGSYKQHQRPTFQTVSYTHLLLNPAACDTLIQRLLPRAAVITPNLREAEALSGLSIRNPDDLAAAAHQLLTLGPAAVLVKGGHLPGDPVSDWLVWREGAEAFTAPRFASRNTHGTGCTLASAIATGLSLIHI